MSTQGRIVVIDDEVNAAAALETLLREDGYEVSSAHEARAGLALLEKTDPDVVLTDLRMPGMDRLESLVGECPEMLAAFKTVRQVAPSSSSVLLLGESGTGKELFALALHQNSPRKDKPFIKVACSALPETLLESELFGHEKGSFTGALYTRA